jgi:hypothetical protein
MANQALGSRYIPEGVNRGNEAFAEFTIGTTMANGDTATVTIPAGQEPTLLPFAFVVVNKAASPNTYAQTPNIAITSYDPTTGTLVMTASGAVTAGATVIVRFIGG